MVNDERYERAIQTVCLLILAGIGLATALYWLQPVMIPFVLALFVAFTLSPLVDFQVRRWRFPRPVAISSALILGVAILLAGGVLATTAMAQLTSNVNTYQRQLGELIDQTIASVPLEKMGIDEAELRRSLGVPAKPAAVEGEGQGGDEAEDDGRAGLPGEEASEAEVAGGSADAVVPPVDVSLSADAEIDDETGMTAQDYFDMRGRPGAFADTFGAEDGQRPGADDRLLSGRAVQRQESIISPVAVRRLLEAIAGTVMSVVSQGVLVMVFLIFLLAGDNALSGSRGGSFGESALTVRHYVATAVFIAALTGVLVGVSLKLLDVEMALTFGFLAFVLNFVPNIGSIVATLLPLPVVLLSDDPSYVKAALALAVPGAIQVVIGNFVTPKIMGRSLGLHPLTILVALIFWGMLWGLAGVLLAVPITAVIRIWLAKSPYTLPVANVMAGRAPSASPQAAVATVAARGGSQAGDGKKNGGKSGRKGQKSAAR